MKLLLVAAAALPFAGAEVPIAAEAGAPLMFAQQGAPPAPGSEQHERQQPQGARPQGHPGRPPGAAAPGPHPAAPPAAMQPRPAPQQAQPQPQPPHQAQPPQPPHHAQPPQPPRQAQPPQPPRHDQPQKPARHEPPPRQPNAPSHPAAAPPAAQPTPHPSTASPPHPPAAPQQPSARPAVPPARQPQPSVAAPQRPAPPQAPSAQRPSAPAQFGAPRPAAQPNHQPTAQQPAAAPPPRGVQDLRRERQETREGDRTIIREPGRVIIRENGRAVIRHDELDRLRHDARNVRVEHRGNETVTTVIRPDGTQIITVVDDRGRLLRRIRRERGRDIVLFENRFRERTGPLGFFIDVPPPAIHIPRDRYIVDADRADPGLLYDTLIAPPVMQVDRRYSLDEVLFNQNLREWMRRVDLDINFATGSWEVSGGQSSRLQAIAAAMRRAIERNPNEIFLIEGHTDAVGNDVDNLSLSDRRAEAVAEILTQDFGIPPENLVTQGYGEQFLKVDTAGPEPRNRRVTVRRITPLLARQ